MKNLVWRQATIINNVYLLFIDQLLELGLVVLSICGKERTPKRILRDESAGFPNPFPLGTSEQFQI